MYGKPKVLFFLSEIGALEAGHTETVKRKGKRLEASELADSLPILGLLVTNESTEQVAVILNDMEDSTFKVAGGATMPLTGYPITDLKVKNEGSIALVAGEVRLNLVNDIESCVLFQQAKKLGVVPYV